MTATIDGITPQKWAFRLTNILNISLGKDHFPIDIETLAREVSHQIYPDEPISLVKGADLHGFEGGLVKAPKDKKGWGIIYNNQMLSQGRQRFTLAHEFGHYLLHRNQYPDGMQCGEQDFVRWDSEYGQVEHQANVFAANLLMPLDDFRHQIDAKTKTQLSDLSACAERYGVSLMAAALRWIDYTERRSILVVSRSGFILWAKSSKSALKSGAFFKTANQSPIEVPGLSPASGKTIRLEQSMPLKHPQKTWLKYETCEEEIIISDHYDFSISLLHLENGLNNWPPFFSK